MAVIKPTGYKEIISQDLDKLEATQVLYKDFLERLVYPKLGKTKVAGIKFSDISV